MNKLLFFSVLGLMFAGCAVIPPVEETTGVPMDEKTIGFADVHAATIKCIEDLLTQDVLKKNDGLKPFVMIDHVQNEVLPHVKTDSLAQDIRLKILMSDKAITKPAPEKKKGKDTKKETAEQLPSFDFLLSGGVNKATIPVDGEPVACFSVHYKLKDLKTGFVVWEREEKLLRDVQ